MRKADYSMLALIIAHEIRMARAVIADDNSCAYDVSVAKGALAAAKNIANEFASIACVDKPQFLKACGIT